VTEPEAEPDGVHSAVGCETCKTVMTRMVKNGASSAILSTRVAACFKLARAREGSRRRRRCQVSPGARRGVAGGAVGQLAALLAASIHVIFRVPTFTYRRLIWAL
jgi:hypothetical protein